MNQIEKQYLLEFLSQLTDCFLKNKDMKLILV